MLYSSVCALFLLPSIDSHINSIDNHIGMESSFSSSSSTDGNVIKARAENGVPQVTTHKSNSDLNLNLDDNHFSSLEHAKQDTVVTMNDGNDISSDRTSHARNVKLSDESLVKKDRAEDNMNNIMQQHSMMPSFTNEVYDNKQDENNKKKGGLTSIGGTVGEIIGALISEVVKLFGDLVGDVAREITAHGFVEFIKSVTGFTGTSGGNPNEKINNFNFNNIH